MLQAPVAPVGQATPPPCVAPTIDDCGRWCVSQAEYEAVMERHSTFLKSVHRHNLHLRASFRGARFDRIDLTAQGKIESAELVDFREAHFRDCTFGELNLAEADFSGASLLGADLSATTNLAEYRLGASDLIYARMPADKLAGLETLREHAARAEKTLYLLVATSAVLITVSLSVRGVTLLRAGGSLTLPTIGIAVPVVLFYRMAPWLLLVLDAAFVSTLTKIWRSLRDLPAVLPSGRFVHREVMSYPNFSLLAVGYWPHLACGRDETRWERRFVALSSWTLVPTALLVVFLTYLSRHDELTTASHVAAFVMSVALSMAGFGRMKAHFLRGMEQSRGVPREGVRRWPARLRAADWVIYWPPTAALPARPDLDSGPPEGESGADATRRGIAEAVPRLRVVSIELVCLALTAVLALVSNTAMKADACPREVSRTAVSPWRCHALAITAKDAQLDSLHLDAINLRRAYLPDAHLVRTDLSDARLQGAYLHGASMDHVKLKDARLTDAILWEAHMDSATLRQVDLRRADLRGAHLPNARLQGADLRGADLTGATLDGAVLCGARINPSESAEGQARLRSALSVTWGADRTDIASLLAVPQARRTDRLLDAQGAPRYLDAREKREFFRWQRAWTHLGGLVKQLRGGAPAGLDRADFAAAIAALDVSSGKTTQQMQFTLRQTVLDAPAFWRDSSRIAYGGRVREEFRAFATKVQEKALNYCVDAPAWDPVTLP